MTGKGVVCTHTPAPAGACPFSDEENQEEQGSIYWWKVNRRKMMLMKCVFSHKVMHLDFVGRDGFFLLFIYIFLKVSNWLKFPNFHLLSFDFFNGGTEHSGTSQEDKNLNAGSRVKASTVCSCSPQSTCSGKETYQGNSTVICASCLFPYSLLF